MGSALTRLVVDDPMDGGPAELEVDYGHRWQDRKPDQVDHVLTDPPYDKRTHAGHALPVRGRAPVSFPPVDPAELVPQLITLTKGWIVCFCALEQLGAYQTAAGPTWFRGGVWDKINPAPQMNGQGPSQGAEGIAIMWAGWSCGKAKRTKPSWQARGKPGIWRHPPDRGAERLHETPKPVGLCRMLLADFTAPGELVFDPFAGCAPMGVAAVELGRRYRGQEIDTRWAADGIKALNMALLAGVLPPGPTARTRLARAGRRLEGLQSMAAWDAAEGS